MNRERLPWMITGVAVAIAIGAIAAPWRRTQSASAPPEKDTAAQEQELSALRRRLVSRENEAGALRSELDRMRRLLEAKKSSDAREAAAGIDELSDDQKRDQAARALTRLDDLMERLHQDPTEEVYRGFQQVLLDLFHAPMDDPTLFEEKYAAAKDPMTKAMLLPHLAAREGEKLTTFVQSELGHTDDPGMRAELITQLRVHSNPEKDNAARGVLLSAMTSEPDPRARQMAIEGLSALQVPEVQEALFRVAAADSDDATRELAIRRLAENPDTRSRVLDVLAKDPNENMRTLGECAARLAASGSAG